MKLLRGSRVCRVLLLFEVVLPLIVSAQSTPNVPEQYKKFFSYYGDQRSLYEKALNAIGLTARPYGRGYALIAGVTHYPNFPAVRQSLRPAEIDIENLTKYLRDQEYFDEIVVLKDGSVTVDNLDYFLTSYFPERLKSPHSRFLFAYSGHGYAVGPEQTATGYLLTAAAQSLTDDVNMIPLARVRTLLAPVIDSAEKVLVLINSCQSGAFLGQSFGGLNPLGPGDRGAHAIMACRASQHSFQLGGVGSGSVFFEKILAGLDGPADKNPPDGVVTYEELYDYLYGQIPLATGGLQKPMAGEISRYRSGGEFFFLNRNRQVRLGNVKEFSFGNAVTFGMQASDIEEQGQTAYSAGQYSEALQAFEQAAVAGNWSAMNDLGVMYWDGSVVQKDEHLAKHWLERGAEAGNPDAMLNFGAMYYLGADGVRRDYKEAKQWFDKAAQGGNAQAMCFLGQMYKKGEGVKRSYDSSREWYEKAAAAGSATGMGKMGELYYEGSGVKRDYAQALDWFGKAAAAGNANAMYNLAFMYENGEGVKKDRQQARQWYERAATAGDKDSAERLRKWKE